MNNVLKSLHNMWSVIKSIFAFEGTVYLTLSKYCMVAATAAFCGLSIWFGAGAVVGGITVFAVGMLLFAGIPSAPAKDLYEKKVLRNRAQRIGVLFMGLGVSIGFFTPAVSVEVIIIATGVLSLFCALVVDTMKKNFLGRYYQQQVASRAASPKPVGAKAGMSWMPISSDHSGRSPDSHPTPAL